ncbi:hypothetical protein XELAEV_18023517mg [Xenopus laevis]|uniref:Uncharacterized protein n=1 Tax=Xenopus laevis TaxID=8355 RepID=A0A974HPR2_XENLA|nr:hypothetical protein XELAEV_18023517mg [Xenopus laevis]
MGISHIQALTDAGSTACRPVYTWDLSLPDRYLESYLSGIPLDEDHPSWQFYIGLGCDPCDRISLIWLNTWLVKLGIDP